MRNVWLVIFILALLTAVGIGVMWYGIDHDWFAPDPATSDKPVPLTTFTISVRDKDTTGLVEGTFDVVRVANTTSTIMLGDTVSMGVYTKGYNTIVLPTNESYAFLFRSPTHYTQRHYVYAATNTTTLVVLRAIEDALVVNIPSNVRLENHTSRTFPIRLSAHADTYLRAPLYCVRWTMGIRSVVLDGLVPAKPPARVRNVDRCYASNNAAGMADEETPVTLSVSVDTLLVSGADFVSVTIVDQDLVRMPNGEWVESPQDANGRDVGAPDQAVIVDDDGWRVERDVWVARVGGKLI